MVPRADEAHGRLIELLATLVEQYESRQLPNPQLAPAQMLAHLLESKQVKPAQVAKATGIPPATISNVLAGRRGVSKANARKLADFFGVSPLVLLEVSAARRTRCDSEVLLAAGQNHRLPRIAPVEHGESGRVPLRRPPHRACRGAPALSLSKCGEPVSFNSHGKTIFHSSLETTT